jgi:DNA mismatch endonuclease (patch repair protein)
VKRHRTTPSFVGLRPASATSSRIKQRNPSRNTQHELLLRRELRKLGIDFHRDDALAGRPDIVFPDAHLAVFCDGDFWHGRDWKILRKKLETGTNGQYWCAKIASNIRRDKKTARILEAQGWAVVRVWESDIKRDAVKIAAKLALRAKARRLNTISSWSEQNALR